MTRRLLSSLSAALLFVSAATGVAAASDEPLALVAGGSCEDTRDFLLDFAVKQSVSGYGMYGGYHPHWGARMRGGVASAPVSEAAPAATAEAAGGVAAGAVGPAGHTTTNVQERGVDEADTVETDGRFIYTVRNREVLILKSWPASETDVVSRLTFESHVTPSGLYLTGNRLAVIAQYYDQKDQFYGTRAMVFDVRNRARPRLERQVDVEGWTVQSRRVGKSIYLVTNSQLRVPQAVYQKAQEHVQRLGNLQLGRGLEPWKEQARVARWLRTRLDKELTVADARRALPRIRAGGSTRYLACGDLYRHPGTDQLGALMLTEISLRDARVDSVGVMATGATVYGSRDAIYVAMPHWDWSRFQSSQSQTVLHKFAIGRRAGELAYEASGAVDGYLHNQFSMSEWRGDLRIATTTSGTGGTSNNLFVVRRRGRALRVIGALRGLAENERIYSARMMGDKGYMVTFRQTDPLFTFDLSDPYNPRVVGELKVNGFSSYIHPLGNDLLLTIGQDATDEGRVTGLHLQVFDVSNPARPTRRHHEKLNITGYSWSPAQHNHLAFTYDPRTKILALPVHFHGGRNDFSGLMLYEIDGRRGIRPRGRVAHNRLVNRHLESLCADRAGKNNWVCKNANRRNWRGWYGGIQRAVIIDDYVYSMGQLGLQVNDLGAPRRALRAVPWHGVQRAKAIAVARR